LSFRVLEFLSSNIFLIAPLDTLLPYLPWRAQFPDSRSAFEWRYHFLSLALCISVCQSLSLILQVLLQLSELSFQILVSLFSSRIFGGSWDNPAEVAQPLIDFTDDCSDSSFLSFRERLNVLSIRVFGNLGRSLESFDPHVLKNYVILEFALRLSSSRRRMACFGVDIRLWKLEFGLGIGLLLLEFLIRLFAICKLLLQSLGFASCQSLTARERLSAATGAEHQRCWGQRSVCIGRAGLKLKPSLIGVRFLIGLVVLLAFLGV
ncbi:hypothetical protein KCU80_g8, partial [Aureobasidium melanogenum]